MKMLSLPPQFLQVDKKIPFGVYDAMGRLLVAPGSVIKDEDRLESLQKRELFVDEKEAGPYRASFTLSAHALLHKEATLEMIALGRVDKNRRAAPTRR